MHVEIGVTTLYNVFMDSLLAHLGFSHCLGIGPMRFLALRQHFESISDAYHADRAVLRSVIGLKTADDFISFRSTFNPAEKLDQLQSKDISIITQEDSLFPPQLHHISDPPICLYVRGSLDLLKRPIERLFAIVGTRNPTSYGARVSQLYARHLSEVGLTIVSGMALGIDSIAHRTTLDSGGTTIAVLGCGVDVIYPPSNRDLYEQIITSGGTVMSEFPPGKTVMKGLFVARNRIVSGISSGVMVVEGTLHSGSLITARHAAAQGRDVFASPGPLTSIYSQAPNMLLKEGAIFTTTPHDIVSEYAPSHAFKKNDALDEITVPAEKSIVNALTAESLTSDDLARHTDLSVSEILNHITSLELAGHIAKDNEGKYFLKKATLK